MISQPNKSNNSIKSSKNARTVGEASKGFHGKYGVRWYKNIGLGFKTPCLDISADTARARANSKVDNKCPFMGDVNIRGHILRGEVDGCASGSHDKCIVIKRTYFHYVKKYERYEKRHSKI